MGQLSLFSRAETAALRDRTKARNYDPERDEFRRQHKIRRDWGLKRRHAEKLRRLRESGAVSPPTATNPPECRTASTSPPAAPPTRATPSPEPARRLATSATPPPATRSCSSTDAASSTAPCSSPNAASDPTTAGNTATTTAAPRRPTLGPRPAAAPTPVAAAAEAEGTTATETAAVPMQQVTPPPPATLQRPTAAPRPPTPGSRPAAAPKPATGAVAATPAAAGAVVALVPWCRAATSVATPATAAGAANRYQRLQGKQTRFRPRTCTPMTARGTRSPSPAQRRQHLAAGYGLQVAPWQSPSRAGGGYPKPSARTTSDVTSGPRTARTSLQSAAFVPSAASPATSRPAKAGRALISAAELAANRSTRCMPWAVAVAAESGTTPTGTVSALGYGPLPARTRPTTACAPASGPQQKRHERRRYALRPTAPTRKQHDRRRHALLRLGAEAPTGMTRSVPWLTAGGALPGAKWSAGWPRALDRSRKDCGWHPSVTWSGVLSRPVGPVAGRDQ